MLDLENVQFFTQDCSNGFWILIALSIVLFIGGIILLIVKRDSVYCFDDELLLWLPIIFAVILLMVALLNKTSNYAIVEVTEPEKCEELLNHQLNDKKFKREGNKLYFIYKIGCDEIKGRGYCKKPLTDNYLKEKIQNDFENEVFKVNFEKKKDIKFLGL